MTNFRVDMVGFVDPHKVVVRRNAFSTFPSAQNGGELEGGENNGMLKHQFSQVEKDWIYKKSLNKFPFQRKEQQGRRCMCEKTKMKKVEKVKKNWVYGEVLHFIAI